MFRFVLLFILVAGPSGSWVFRVDAARAQGEDNIQVGNGLFNKCSFNKDLCCPRMTECCVTVGDSAVKCCHLFMKQLTMPIQFCRPRNWSS